MDIDLGLGWLELGLYFASLGFRLFAFVDAVVRPSAAYEAAGKLTKTGWLVILGLGLAVGLVLPGYLNLFNLAALIAAIVYVVDVRPAVREIGRPGPREGPYGPW